MLLGGCAFAPSIPLFGAAFPDWLLCILGGITGTILVHLALSRRGAILALAPLVSGAECAACDDRLAGVFSPLTWSKND
ncbi:MULTISPECIES: YtcA family lipoprotein [Paraburkholderia]|uniref:YtcA family lipoprotein n=1 Tax=Paraburkholderia unamae TaxID=219649 RepID=A0ACC6RTY3_9BURK